MKDKKVRILCAVTALVSLLAVVPVMFDFFKIELSDFWGETYGYSTVIGYQVYADTDQPINIVLGVFGLLGMLWDLVFGAFALIDGRYKNLLWRIIRYGYFYGIVMGLLNFAFIASYYCYYGCGAGSVIFLILTAAVIALKFALIFTKTEGEKTLPEAVEPKQQEQNTDESREEA